MNLDCLYASEGIVFSRIYDVQNNEQFIVIGIVLVGKTLEKVGRNESKRKIYKQFDYFTYLYPYTGLSLCYEAI